MDQCSCRKVNVVGGGVVGTATGQGFLHHGYDVAFVDTNPDRLRELRSMRYSAEAELDCSGEGSFIFVTVPTPLGVDGGWDLSYVEASVTAIGESLRYATRPHTVVVRSTVPPGTCDHVVTPLLEKVSGQRANRDFFVASAPEFLRAASALEDFLAPRVTLIASRDAETRRDLERLFSPFGGEMRSLDNPTAAELIKIAHNAFNATKISFWNEMWLLAREFDLDLDQVAAVVARSADASINPNYGIRGGRPFSGSCLPKDVQGLRFMGRSLGLDLPVIDGVFRVNEAMAARSGAPESVESELAAWSSALVHQGSSAE
jgi:UDPglucose 6-dehydrogenase